MHHRVLLNHICGLYTDSISLAACSLELLTFIKKSTFRLVQKFGASGEVIDGFVNQTSWDCFGSATKTADKLSTALLAALMPGLLLQAEPALHFIPEEEIHNI